MSHKSVRTTADLIRFKCALKVDCTNCGSGRTVSARAAFRGLGPVQLDTARHRFKCIRCGAKQAKIMVLPPV